ncbi:HAMP domain-containing sensor histidine kinase [Shewanella litorisediminis]|uniref:histidine kinase n=1 Tax=Shewanella litorisediminis TaxID=1173586 RepID=A0ABX7FYN7_9GAMM|nr:ATP-binding protein [Shewanella litorisediminis]MCL2919263.1 histidine kinase sensor domain-containing protein [Shewanella litorisediminis]QRH00145.1 histidine kinase sensor domain-containing protein [Shewanella litorisediminis]
MKLSRHHPFSRLQWRLFGYFGTSLLVILLLASLIEAMVLHQLLVLPKETKAQLSVLAREAEALVRRGDHEALAEWETAQPFRLHVINSRLEGVSGRPIHPHFEFKLGFMLGLDQALGDRVQKPIIGLPIYATFDTSGPLLLAVQLNANLHPAKDLSYSLWAIRLTVGLFVLWLFSRLLGHYLIKPLATLQQGTRALANGKLSTRIGEHFSAAEPEFYQLGHDFDEMADVIERTLTTQERLIRDVSHELRTPLARQKLAADLLESDLAESSPYLRRIHTENNELSRLIDTLLGYSRLASGYQAAHSAPFTLHELASSLLGDCRFEAAPTQRIEWQDLAACRHIALETDQSLLQRALENLVRNSLKYAGTECHIQIRSHCDNNWLNITVADDGPGIDAAKLETLFHPFTRFDEARHASQGGFGLGLAIVRECVRLLGGDVSAGRSELGGLEVRLSLPMRLKRLAAAKKAN